MNRIDARSLGAALTLVCLIAMARPMTAQADMVFSESFESPAVNDSGGASTAFYTVGTGNLKVYDNLNYISPATDGHQYLVTNPDSGPSGGSISWSFVTGVGTYTLTFDHRIFGFSAGNQTLGITVTSSSPGDLLSTSMVDNRIGIPTSTLTFSDTFTTTGSTAGLVTLTLKDNTPGAIDNGNDLIVDNIQVNGPPVPEPASIALLGLAGLAVLRRRR